MSFTSPPLPDSMAHIIQMNLAQEPTKEVFIMVGPEGEQHITCAEIDAHARYSAQRLLASGVKAGDLLLMLLEHAYEPIPLFLGALYIGAIPMVLPYFVAQKHPSPATRAFGRSRALLPTRRHFNPATLSG
jgi:acyl-CoA synthetase (AMP-forming)/AMP-acid ligase II